MKRSLVRYNNPPSGTALLFGVAIIGLIIWLITKSRAVAQYNEERVVIERDERGRIAAMSVHRSAHQ